MAAGKIKLQANDGKVLSLVAPDGMVEDTTKSLLDSTNTSIPLSTQLKGTYSLSNTVKTLAFNAFTYTGQTTSGDGTNVGDYVWNGTTLSLNTGVSTIDFTQASNGTGFYHDRNNISGNGGDCVVVNDAGTIIESGEIAFKDVAGVDGICKVHIKNRSGLDSHYVVDGIRGGDKPVYTNMTIIEDTYTAGTLSFTNNGVSLGSANVVNKNLDNYISYVTLYTHIKFGKTNQDKRYIEAYNPVTNDTMIMYQGSGVAGHEIPHSVGVALDFVNVKNLNAVVNWISTKNDLSYGYINLTNAFISGTPTTVTALGTISTTLGSFTWINALDQAHILYGKAKSKTWTIVQYTGTGVAGNFVETKDVDGVAKRPRRVIIKRIDNAESWYMWDSERGNTNYLKLDTSAIEGTTQVIEILSNGFKDVFGNSTANNASGGQYIALVEFDTDGTGSSGAYFDNPTDTTQLQLTDGLVSISNGYNVYGADNKVVSKSGTIVPTGGYV